VGIQDAMIAWPIGSGSSIAMMVSPHPLERMDYRDIHEVDLRTLSAHAQDHGPHAAEGRCTIAARYRRWRWETGV
jgi:hypothetical protein